MKKIGILTFHRSFNYGAFMQCFSLCERLKKDFPDACFEVVDYTSPKILATYEREVSQAKDKKAKQLKERNQAFLSCQEKLPLSDLHEISDQYETTCAYMNEHYDAVIVGSDAVWNWIVRGFPNLYFLKGYRGKKFSYAASVHGMDYTIMSKEQKNYLKEAFEDFEYIGVRDTATEKMVQFVAPHLAPIHNCDPTMFLDLDQVPCDKDALKQKMICAGVDFSKPLIGVMAGNTIGQEIKRRFKNKVQLIGLYQHNRNVDVFLHDLSPFEWAHVFSFFNATLTHFFHGTMLSLVNGTPVIAIEPVTDFSVKHTTKIKDLLTRLGLEEWREENDCRNRSFADKVLYRLGLKENRLLWDRVANKIDSFLNDDWSKHIHEKCSAEAQTYLSFYKSLNNFLKGQIKND